MEKQRFIPVTAFGNHFGNDPLSFVTEGEGRKALVSLMVEEKTNEVSRFVKVEGENISFCASLAFDFLNSINTSFCQHVMRGFGFDWVTTSKN